MRLRPWRFVPAAAAAVLLLFSGARADILVQLRFDGQPFEPAAIPDVTCFSSTLDRWVSCRLHKAAGPGAYVLGTLDPGAYRIHVSIDENPENPRRYPGDYEAQLPFEVTATGPERLTVDLARLIHLTRPGDNARSFPDMLRGCTRQPQFETPRFSWGPSASVDFAWDAVVPGAEYRYTLVARACGRAGVGRDVVSAQTDTTAITLSLPPSADGEYYVFRVEAWKNDHLIGDLYTHDSGAHSWNYRFRVRNASLPRWSYLTAGGGLVLLVVVARRRARAHPRPLRGGGGADGQEAGLR